MNTDRGSELEERLARRFALAMADARRDYPSLGIGRAITVPTASVRRQRRLIAAAVSFALVAVAIGAAALFVRPAENAGPAATSPAATIPPTIDGQRVYTLEDFGQAAGSDTSFLLRAYVRWMPVSCPVAPITFSTSPERDLVADACDALHLTALPSGSTPNVYWIAPRTRDLLTPWLGGPEIVIRVHTHDPTAASCRADVLTLCETALVIEAVVWPTTAGPTRSPSPSAVATPTLTAEGVPSEIEGLHVYSYSDAVQLRNSKGSFLIAGQIGYSLTINGCSPQRSPTPAPSPKAVLDLLGGRSACDAHFALYAVGPFSAGDYIVLADKSDLGLDPNGIAGRPIVIRAHFNDPEAADCPPADRLECQQRLVAEAVVWPGNASPLPTAKGPQQQFGPDGVPTSLNGTPVHRAADLQQGSFWLGGRLELETGCDFATEQALRCGYTVDGVPLGSRVGIPPNLVGSIVVVEVVRAMPALSCPPGPCPGKEPVVTIQTIIWVQPQPSATAARSN